MNFRIKSLIALFVFIIFWFVVFYPIIVPFMFEINLYPLIAAIIYEMLFYFTLVIAGFVVLGEDKKHHSFKWSFVIFALYHVVDAVEPPFVLNSNGVFDLSSSAIVSWDYGIGYTLQQVFGMNGPALYYVTNIGVVLILLLAAVFVITPQALGKIMRKILKD